MQIEKSLYQSLTRTLQYSVDSGEQQWLSGCYLRYCQECRSCGFSDYKIRPILDNGKVSGLYLDYDGSKSEPITASAGENRI